MIDRCRRKCWSVGGRVTVRCAAMQSRCGNFMEKLHYELAGIFMKRRLVKLIHHLLGLPVPSAYSFSTSRAAVSCRVWTRYCRR